MSQEERKHVLVVDDEPALRQAIAKALRGANIKVTTAGSGKEAISIAIRKRPDLLVMDVMLGDCTGLEVIDALRSQMGDIPAVVITGYGDAKTLTEASRRRPVELMTKPLDLVRLRNTVEEALDRQTDMRRSRRRTKRLRRLARTINIERKNIHRQLDKTCASLATAYRSLSSQLSLQQMVISYQNDLVSARNDDDVFRSLFRVIIERSGPVYGVAMVCDASAELQIVGRFGVPVPDNLAFCQELSRPIIEVVLVSPACTLIDAAEEADMFCESIREYLPGVTILAIPLIPAAGEMIGLVVLYRKGEQPFCDSDIGLAELIAPATALAIRRND